MEKRETLQAIVPKKASGLLICQKSRIHSKRNRTQTEANAGEITTIQTQLIMCVCIYNIVAA